MIDRQTVDKIKEAANIVDVVSEFVTLRKSGANYKGLCPFHNEKTPSFIVTPSRNTCHCFGCGQGGTPISFIMLHEQMTYPEALRWLANKYHIEIKERELTNEEKEAESERESMFIVNERIAKYFEDTLHENKYGISIGMQYFRSRGFRDDIIRKFRLGYDLPQVDALPNLLLQEGYKEKYFLHNDETGVGVGICYKSDRDGKLIDRFAGRVVFPWFNLSGKVVGFNARKLDSATKGVQQKYVNSPASNIYQKDHELYGIHLAKKAISKEDNVFIVEGQTDVIAMHQCGIENVVAGSGTAFSANQARTLRRFSNNITLIYDNDDAGRHAAMERIDMMLPEGINLKLLFLPEGEDPDSFARKHTSSDFKKYIEEHQIDFLQFKIDMLLKNENDPLKQSEAINSILESISLIPDQILRDTYIHHCSIRTGRGEALLINTMNKFIRSRKERKLGGEIPSAPKEPSAISASVLSAPNAADENSIGRLLAQLIVKDGEKIIYRDVDDGKGNKSDVSVAQYVSFVLESDGITFANPMYNRLLNETVEHLGDPHFRAEQYFLEHHDIDISRLATELTAEKYILDEVEQQQPENKDAQRQAEEREMNRLRQKTIHLVLDFQLSYVEGRLKSLQDEIKQSANDTSRMLRLMKDYKDMQTLRNELAKKLGSNVIN